MWIDVCETCEKAVSSGVRPLHMRGHRRHKCMICYRTFSYSGILTKQLRINYEGKSYTCKTCGKALSNPGNLRRHMIIHERNGNRDTAVAGDDESTETMSHVQQARCW